MKTREREALRTLADCLAEAHETDRKTYAAGRSHGGDGAAGCSYCEAIRDARTILRTNDSARGAWDLVDLIARMKTEEEFGDDSPPSEDWIGTLNELIETARKLQRARNKGA
jgi:hypothetical protein